MEQLPYLDSIHAQDEHGVTDKRNTIHASVGRECINALKVFLLPPSKVPKSEKAHRDLLVDNLAMAHKIASERNTEKKKAMKERYEKNMAEPKF